MDAALYAIAIGSNRRGRHGGPVDEVCAAISTLEGVVATARVMTSPPLGPSIRRFANTVVLVESDQVPPLLLERLKRIERDFGRRRGARWGARVIDLDIVLWSGGAWRSKGLTVPHEAFRARDFVLAPLLAVAPEWRDPLTGLSMRHLHARLTRPERTPNATAVGP